jgi:hypothetical protein
MKNSTLAAFVSLVFILTQLIFLLTWKDKGKIAGALCSRFAIDRSFDEPLPPNARAASGSIPSARSFKKHRIDYKLEAEILGGIPPRTWQPVLMDHVCYPVEERWWHNSVQRKPAKRGLLFVKEMKTGSSSIAGIVLRIARNLPKRFGFDFEQCSSRVDHTPARVMDYKNRNVDESFLFTFLREPSARYLSQFFHFKVSREKFEPSDKVIQEYFRNTVYLHDYYLRELSLIEYPSKQLSLDELPLHRVKAVNAIVRNYDFIGITERMDESLVVMQILLNLPTSDLLYIKAKSKGGFDDGAFNHTCFYIVPSFTSSGMKNWFENSTTWNTKIRGDEMLYEVANRSLDLTIDALGRDSFEEKLQRFRRAQTLAREKCSAGLKLPCSSNGIRAKVLDINKFECDCLWLDSGCGYKCLDAISEEVDNI